MTSESTQMPEAPSEQEPSDGLETNAAERSVRSFLARAFVRIGVLPVLMVIALVVFAMMSENFLTMSNLLTALRQNAFIIIITLAQFVVLLSGGFDLSVGAVTALVSVSTAMAMAAMAAGGAAPLLAVAVGIGVGLAVGLICGLVNAIGVAALRINPFIMTLGTASIFQGVALHLTAGVPVYGLPREFSNWFGFGRILGIGVAIWIAALVVAVMAFLMKYTRRGRHLYAVGASPHAAKLSGVPERSTLVIAYATSGVLAALGAILLTARIEVGDANVGSDLPLQTIAAAVIGGVSLGGGKGKVINAVLGAIFLGLVVNGMNLARIVSYYQMIVLGSVLAIAVVADRLRHRVAADVYAGKV